MVGEERRVGVDKVIGDDQFALQDVSRLYIPNSRGIC
jgi:hypothetical protein